MDGGREAYCTYAAAAVAFWTRWEGKARQGKARQDEATLKLGKS